MFHLLALAVIAQAPDTVVFSAAEALERALEVSSVVQASRSRTLAAESRIRQAGLLSNPTISAAAENLGAAVETTGLPAWQGVEGQILLGLRIPVGGDRGAALRKTRAWAEEATANERSTVLDVHVQALDAIARFLHDRAILDHARTDADGIQRLADQVRQQADLGRASEGDAARLRLASASAWTRVASARASESESSAELGRLLGLAPDTPMVVNLPMCVWEDPVPVASVPDLDALSARVRGWEATASELTAGAIPDLLPHVGWRRSAGFDALYVGLEFQLPVFDRNQGARGAARLEAAAAEEDRAALTAALDAQRAAARQALEALEEAGDRFDAGWNSALELAVESAEARYALGEGTLTELLDGRRARLDALVDFEAWRMQLFAWRARLGRRSGAALTDRVLCDPSPLSSNGGGLPRGAAEPSQEASR